jgi:bacterioferritin-associated ferredoxin
MKLCVCKNISEEEFIKAASDKTFEDAVSQLKLGSMCKTCLNQANRIYIKLKSNS